MEIARSRRSARGVAQVHAHPGAYLLIVLCLLDENLLDPEVQEFVA